ncbi:MAG TPA: alpha/beta hydrolase, partial [Symbiobacteriaceae bacterium]|nr:alpha/beta hydrolase [Symbiobacteriaceae bacterium]
DRLGSVCRCIAIDIRGHGRSGLGDRPWRFADIAADVAMLTRALQLEDPVLVGYSSGASIAMLAAIEEPALYGGIVAVSAFSECCTTTMKLKVGLGLMALNLGLLRFIGPNIISSNSTGKAHTRAMLPDAKQVSPIALRSFFMETVRNNFTHRLHAIRVPVLLVYGTQDDWMHGYYRTLREKLPDARAVFFPDVDHRVPTRRPDFFADAVAEFIARLDVAPFEEDLPVLPSYEHPGVEEYPLH